MIITDLETVDPRGRLDVLVYRGAQWFANHIEQQHGLSGIWDNAKPLVNSAVVEGLKGYELPPELKMILGIIQANIGKK